MKDLNHKHTAYNQKAVGLLVVFPVGELFDVQFHHDLLSDRPCFSFPCAGKPGFNIQVLGRGVFHIHNQHDFMTMGELLGDKLWKFEHSFFCKTFPWCFLSPDSAVNSMASRLSE